VKGLVRRFVQRVKPEAKVDLTTGEISLSFKGAESNPEPLAPEVFAPPGELSQTPDFAWLFALTNFSRFPNLMEVPLKTQYGTKPEAETGRICFRGIATDSDGRDALRKTAIS
jgi:hypothetical protein